MPFRTVDTLTPWDADAIDRKPKQNPLDEISELSESVVCGWAALMGGLDMSTQFRREMGEDAVEGSQDMARTYEDLLKALIKHNDDSREMKEARERYLQAKARYIQADAAETGLTETQVEQLDRIYECTVRLVRARYTLAFAEREQTLRDSGSRHAPSGELAQKMAQYPDGELEFVKHTQSESIIADLDKLNGLIGAFLETAPDKAADLAKRLYVMATASKPITYDAARRKVILEKYRPDSPSTGGDLPQR